MSQPPSDPSTPISRTERRARRSHTRRRTIVIALVVLVLLVGGAVAFALTQGDDHKAVAAPPSTTSSTTTTSAPTVPPAVTATTKVPDLSVYDSPADGAKVATTLSAVTEYGLPRTLLVTQQQGDWLESLLPIRPNGAKGWVKASDVTLGATTMRIDISLSAHTLTFSDGATQILTAPVAIGKDQTPTPVGTFYITDPVDLQSRPNGAYGAFALGLSGYSDVLKSFNGGPGQIAVHGTANPGDLGKNVSNGCVRVANDVILQIANRVGLGTPVNITA